MSYEYIDIEDVTEQAEAFTQDFLIAVHHALSSNTAFRFSPSVEFFKANIVSDHHRNNFNQTTLMFALEGDRSLGTPEEHAQAMVSGLHVLSKAGWFLDRAHSYAPWVRTAETQKDVIKSKMKDEQEAALRRGRRTDNLPRARREQQEAEERARRRMKEMTVELTAGAISSFMADCFDRLQRAVIDSMTHHAVRNQKRIDDKALERTATSFGRGGRVVP